MGIELFLPLQGVELKGKEEAPSADTDVALNVAATYTVLGFSLPYRIDRLSRILPLEIRFFEMAREPIEEGFLSNRYDIAVFLTSNNVKPA